VTDLIFMTARGRAGRSQNTKGEDNERDNDSDNCGSPRIRDPWDYHLAPQASVDRLILSTRLIPVIAFGETDGQ
jgi:hypothetical protein